jgi:hypothetical protein
MTKKPSHAIVFSCSLPALILSAACLLPYINKAFTIDDPVYVLQAQQTHKEPLHPMALDVCWWEGAECGPVGNQMVSREILLAL